jgi:hypothetical protein
MEQRPFSLFPARSSVALDVFEQTQSVVVLDHEAATSRLDRDMTHGREHTRGGASQ